MASLTGPGFLCPPFEEAVVPEPAVEVSDPRVGAIDKDALGAKVRQATIETAGLI
jgi:hypothetical protein